MTNQRVLGQAVGVGLLLLAGCDVARNARSDLASLEASLPTSAQPRKSASSTPHVATKTRADATTPNAAAADTKGATFGEPISNEPTRNITTAPPIKLVGMGESDVRALLGPPTSEEDRAPGKTWRYRDGSCTVDIQFYPDVQTRKFGTLAYEVKSDDDSDEGKRVCLAQLQSRARVK